MSSRIYIHILLVRCMVSRKKTYNLRWQELLDWTEETATTVTTSNDYYHQCHLFYDLSLGMTPALITAMTMEPWWGLVIMILWSDKVMNMNRWRLFLIKFWITSKCISGHNSTTWNRSRDNSSQIPSRQQPWGNYGPCPTQWPQQLVTWPVCHQTDLRI